MAYQKTKQKVDKQFILDRITEEDIFEYYLGLSAKIGRLYRNPLRKDRHPTCSFSRRNGRLRFRDWSDSTDKDCFDIVMYMFNLDYGSALEKIASDFDLIDTKIDVALVERLKKIREQSRSQHISVIQATIQKFRKPDIRYLKSFGLSGSTCRKFKCYSIKKLWLNGQSIYHYRDSDPCIGYYFGKDEVGREQWKIYFYRRKERRFLTNTNKINGWDQLPKTYPTLIITKSMKDVMVLHELGFHSIAPQAETNIIPEIIINLLFEKFDYIYVLYDFDLAGIRGANRLKRDHGVQPFFLTNGRFGSKDYKAKDISDLVRDYGKREAIKTLYKWIYETRFKKQ